jgi:hypothetical protein
VTARSPAAAAAAALLACAGCADAPLTSDAPRSVSGVGLAPFEIREDCARLRAGERLEYAFEASEPVAFEIRYREGGAVIAPLVRVATRSDAGVFPVRLDQTYCAVWEAGPTGAVVDYRLRLRSAAP